MLVILLSLTLCLMAFLPFFQTRAASEFSTPLTEMSFIEQLYQSNYIQYKYLKEKTDQKNWSYSDLYLTIDYLGSRESGDPEFSASSATYQIADRISSDASSDTPVSDGDLEEALYNVFLSQIDEMKAGAEKLTQYVDYCAQDMTSGTQIGNSSVSELTALLNGQTSTKHSSYIYYAVIEYDAAGHVSSCRAYFGDESDSFLKKLETAGREQYFQQFSDDSDSLLLDFDSDSGQTYRYRVSLSGPSNMRIIYALTQQQYQKILSSRDLFMSYANYDSLQYQSYCAAGVPNVLTGFFTASFLFGCVLVLLFEKRGYCIRSFSICQLPIEIAAVLLCLFFPGAYFLTRLICDVQHGQLFPNLTKHVLSPLHLSGTLYLFLAIVFFLCFFAAFLLGTIAAGCLHSKQELREHSLIIRYWRRIMNAWNRFYQELVSFDIGTDARKMISKLVVVNFIILFVITFFWVWGFVPLLIYSLILYFLLKKYVHDIQTKYQNLLRATSSIARGDFDTAFSEDFGVFESYKKELLQIQTDFKKAVEEDVCGRAASVQKEIDFVLAHEDVANVFGDMLANGELPLRVTHNDTKLNNIMIDDKTGKGICVIDLDTVMPGLAMNDFGDSIRFGASTAAEDEQDLSKVSCDMELFDVYAKGFIEGCGGKLTQKEIEMMPMGAKVMTFECGMRFLTDYLQGDTYFKIHREEHNLDRCRTQFKLVSDMEKKWGQMHEIVKKYM